MIPETSHPYWLMHSVVSSEPAVKTLYLSYYLHRPQSLVDERTLLAVSRANFLDPQHIAQLIDRCPPDQELAIQSAMDCTDGVVRHIHMVDMSTSSRAHLGKLKAFVGAETFHGYAWFETGRSYHGYGNQLVTQEQWVAYMGLLLLSNQKDLKATVDPRWIAHRLIAGFATLRWSRNTKHYLRLPHRISG